MTINSSKNITQWQIKSNLNNDIKREVDFVLLLKMSTPVNVNNFFYVSSISVCTFLKDLAIVEIKIVLVL